MFNGVIDVSHHNRIDNWTAVRQAGVVAVVHKATEGATFRDPAFTRRRVEVKATGLLWGSYHFSSGVDVAAQVDNYLAHASPEADELICLDYEESTAGADMTLGQAEAFVDLVERRLGRAPLLYGGRLLRDTLAGKTAPLLSRCPLWYARFADEPAGVPSPWERWTFWQYTDGRAGPEPREVEGIGPVDRDLFNGSETEFFARWPF
jgi:lysozyme